MPPERIAGRYRVERVIGQGGMGSVWLCTDELLGRKVAVKQVGTMPGEATLDAARALREARNSAALQHRNVVSIYDAVEDGDRIWLVMELVAGRTLSEVLATEGALPPERAVWIGEQVAEGLAAAHARGTIHRDVKPGNILLTADDVAKISDFGIARTSGDPELTQAGLVTGTPAYFSPEVARGEPPTPAADVWALGATLYAAVEGRPLFPEQDNPIAMLRVITSTPPPRPEHAGFLTEPITRMLDPDPRSRWSMTDVAHVLRRLRQRHAMVDTRAVTAAFRSSQPSTPEAPPPPAAVSPPEAADADEAPAWWSTAEEPASEGASEGASEDAPVTRRSDHAGRLVALGAAALLVVAALGGFLLLRDLDSSPHADTARQAGGRTARSTATHTRRPSPSPAGSRTASPTPSATPSVTPSITPSATPSATPPATGTPIRTSDPREFVARYYATLPSDTADAWASLSPEYQQRIGYGRYRGFWRTIRAVTVTSTRTVGKDAVDVSLTYTSDNGSTESEVRRIYLQDSGGGYLIRQDAVVG